MRRVKRCIIVLELGLMMFLFSPLALAQGVSTSTPAQSRYQDAQQRYNQSVNAYRNAHERLKDVRASTTAAQQAIDERVRSYLVHTVDTLSRRLEALKHWVENEPAMSLEDKASIVASIDADMAWLSTQMSNLDEVSSDELQFRAEDIRDYWQNHQFFFMRINGRILVARLQFVVNKAEVFSERVDNKIDELDANGYAVTKLESLHEEYDQNIDSAQTELDSAIAAFSSITDAGNALELYRQGLEHVKMANRYIHGAFSTLRQIILTIHGLAQSN